MRDRKFKFTLRSWETAKKSEFVQFTIRIAKSEEKKLTSGFFSSCSRYFFYCCCCCCWCRFVCTLAPHFRCKHTRNRSFTQLMYGIDEMLPMERIGSIFFIHLFGAFTASRLNKMYDEQHCQCSVHEAWLNSFNDNYAHFFSLLQVLAVQFTFVVWIVKIE